MHIADGLWCVLPTLGTGAVLHGRTGFLYNRFLHVLSFFPTTRFPRESDDGQRSNIGNFIWHDITSLTDTSWFLSQVALRTSFRGLGRVL